MSSRNVIYRAITAALVPAPTRRDNEAEKIIAQFLASTIRLAPFHLRMGVRMTEAALLLWLVFTARGFIFGTCTNACLRAALSRFERLSGGGATLLRLYRSLILLAWFERGGAAA